MSELKACLFDLDGVIVDTAKYHYRAWQHISKELNIPFSIEDNEKLKGVSRMDSLDIILKLGGLDLPKESKNDLAAKKNEIYQGFISKMEVNEILPGVEQLLNELKSNNIKIALGSSSKNAIAILNKVGLYTFFDEIIDGNMVQKSKPDPEVFLLGAHRLGLKPHNCIVLEDAEAGIEAAIQAQIMSIGVGSMNSLSKADLVVDSLDQLNLSSIQSLFMMSHQL